MDDRPSHSGNTLTIICLILLFAALWYLYAKYSTNSPFEPLP